MSTQDRITVRVDADLEDLVPGFLANRGKDVDSIRQMCEAVDLAGLARIGHNLKGCGSAYGFDRVSEIGAEVELRAKAGNAKAIEALATDLADYLARVDVVFETPEG